MKSRDKRRRVKRMMIERQQGFNPAGVTPIAKATQPAGGKWCRVRRAQIDEAVCTVQSVRTPVFCKGCSSVRGAEVVHG